MESSALACADVGESLEADLDGVSVDHFVATSVSRAAT